MMPSRLWGEPQLTPSPEICLVPPAESCAKTLIVFPVLTTDSGGVCAGENCVQFRV
jgi:hypothetical protein